MNALKITSLFLFLIIASASVAQTEKGGFLVSGSLSVSSSKSEYNAGNENTYTSFFFGPKVGYFFIDRFMVGLSLPFSFSKSKYTGVISDEIKGTSRGIGIGPFVRYYIPAGEKLFLLTHAGYTHSAIKSITRSDDSESEYKSTSNQFNIAAGATYFFNKNVGVEGLLNYQITKQKEADEKSSRIALEAGLQIYFSR